MEMNSNSENPMHLLNKSLIAHQKNQKDWLLNKKYHNLISVNSSIYSIVNDKYDKCKIDKYI